MSWPRTCSQSIKVNFPQKIFLGSEYNIVLPRYGDMITSVRLVLNLPGGNTFYPKESIIDNVNFIVKQNVLENISGDFLEIYNDVFYGLEKKQTYENLLKGPLVTLDIPFTILRNGFHIVTDPVIQLRLGKSSSYFQELKGYLLVDYSIIEDSPEKSFFQIVTQNQNLRVFNKSSSYLKLDTYFSGPVYTIFFTSKVDNVFVDKIKNIKFISDGIERFNLSSQYLKYSEPLKRYKSVPTNPILFYSFALDPNKIPSGSMNFSRIERQRFEIELIPNTDNIQIDIWVQSYNFVYFNSSNVSPVFNSYETLLECKKENTITTLQDIPLKLSYVFYTKSASIFYSSSIFVTSSIVSRIPSSILIDSSKYGIINITNATTVTYIVLEFSAPGYKTSRAAITLEIGKSFHITFKDSNNYSNASGMYVKGDQNLIISVNQSGYYSAYMSAFVVDSSNGKQSYIMDSYSSIKNQITGLEVGGDGSVYIGGTSNRNIYNGDEIKYVEGNGGFIIKYDKNFNPLWVYDDPGLYPKLFLNTYVYSVSDVFGGKLNATIKTVSCSQISMMLDDTGNILVGGINSSGQLGNGDFVNSKYGFFVPSSMPINPSNTGSNQFNTIKKVSMGYTNAAILDVFGNLYMCGAFNSSLVFVLVATNIFDVSCGYQHSAYIDNYGNLYTSGDNLQGQLGTGDNDPRNVFTQITFDGTSVSVSCGSYHTAIVDTNGYLFVTGFNIYGQLGTGDTNDRTTLTEVATNVQSVSCGLHTTAIIDNSDNLLVTGANFNGQLGTGDTSDRTTFTGVATNVNSVSCGVYHTAIIDTTDNLLVTGDNTHGQLGTGDTTSKIIFTGVATNVKSVSGGLYHTAIIDTSDNLLVTGDNTYGQLGIGSFITNYITDFTPTGKTAQNISTGFYTTAYSIGSTYSSCGLNSAGILGTNNTVDSYTFVTPYSVSGLVPQTISAGYEHTAITTTDGNLHLCGSNSYGQLGTNDSTNWPIFKKISLGRKIVQISCGGYHTCIIDSNGNLFSCGRNDKGQLGLGDYTYRSTFQQVNTSALYSSIITAVACGMYHTGILDSIYYAYTTGDNTYGQLALEQTSGGLPKTNIFTVVPITEVIEAVQISCGYMVTIMIDRNNIVYESGIISNFGTGGFTTNYDTNGVPKIRNETSALSSSCGLSNVNILVDGNSSVWAQGSVYPNYNSGLGKTPFNSTTFTKVSIFNTLNGLRYEEGYTAKDPPAILAASVGVYQTVMCDSNGELWVCGSNADCIGTSLHTDDGFFINSRVLQQYSNLAQNISISILDQSSGSAIQSKTVYSDLIKSNSIIADTNGNSYVDIVYSAQPPFILTGTYTIDTGGSITTASIDNKYLNYPVTFSENLGSIIKNTVYYITSISSGYFTINIPVTVSGTALLTIRIGNSELPPTSGNLVGCVLLYDNQLNLTRISKYGTKCQSHVDRNGNYYVAYIDSHGTYLESGPGLWKLTITKSNPKNCIIEVDFFGNIYLVGDYSYDSTVTSYTPPWSSDSSGGTFIMQIDKDGNVKWTIRIINGSATTISRMKSNKITGMLYVAGYSLGNATTTITDVSNKSTSIDAPANNDQEAAFEFSFDPSGNVNPFSPLVPAIFILNTNFEFLQGEFSLGEFIVPTFYPPTYTFYPPSSLITNTSPGTYPLATLSNQPWGNGNYTVIRSGSGTDGFNCFNNTTYGLSWTSPLTYTGTYNGSTVVKSTTNTSLVTGGSDLLGEYIGLQIPISPALGFSKIELYENLTNYSVEYTILGSMDGILWNPIYYTPGDVIVSTTADCQTSNVIQVSSVELIYPEMTSTLSKVTRVDEKLNLVYLENPVSVTKGSSVTFSQVPHKVLTLKPEYTYDHYILSTHKVKGTSTNFSVYSCSFINDPTVVLKDHLLKSLIGVTFSNVSTSSSFTFNNYSDSTFNSVPTTYSYYSSKNTINFSNNLTATWNRSTVTPTFTINGNIYS